MKKIIYTILIGTSLTFIGCTKDHSEPTVGTVPTGTIKTIAEVRDLYQPGVEFIIEDDISIHGVVTADESNGNLYKESYIQDETGALYLRFQSNSGLYIGDSVRVYLKGVKMLKYNQMLQIDSVHADDAIQKLSTQKYRTPEVVEINDVLNNIESFQAKLIQLNNVRFVEANQGKTYADGENQVSGTRVLQNINGDQIDVRTSGYANFASDTLPGGSGTFIAVVAQYNSGAQLLIRDPNELEMGGSIPEEIIKDFDDQSLTSGGWSTHHLAGPSYTAWDIFASSNSAAKVTCYNSSTQNGEVSDAWLISPSLNLSNSTAPYFNFRNVVRYGLTPQLQVKVSMDYDGTSDPTTATWTNLTSLATWDTDDSSWSTWTNSGDIDLTPYKAANVHIAFEYIGENISGVSTWEIDDIRILK